MTKKTVLQQALHQLIEGHHLTREQSAQAMGELMDGKVTDACMAAYLVALRLKGETTEEVLGAVMAMRERAARIAPRATRIMDTCGTGGDGAGTFNISTAVSLVCAGAGLTVAKHGNRAISSQVGSADVLEALGVRIDLSPQQVCQCIEEVGIGFLFAPHHHSALRHAAGVRKELGIRTLLNLLGPMTNPAGATHQLVGVYDGTRVHQVAEVLGRLGAHRAMVVHGSDGLDEITLAGSTTCALWDGEHVKTFEIEPGDFGIPCVDASHLAGGNAAENAAMIRSVLSGQAGHRTDVVRLNAGAALWVAGQVDKLESGVEKASEILSAGTALETLDRLVEWTERNTR
jgi:anthranilate phosphoribosyltransferase